MSQRDTYADGHSDGYEGALIDVTSEVDRCTSVHATQRVLEQLRYQYLEHTGRL